MTPLARRGVVTITGHIAPPVYRFVAACPGFTKWLGAEGVLFEATRKHVALWNEHFPNVPIEDADGTLARLEMQVAPIEHQERLTMSPSTPWAHQARAVDIGISREFFLFAHDMGTGKSWEIINIAAELFARGVIERALVSTKRRGIPQFMLEEIPAHMPRSVKYRVARLPSTQAKRAFQYPDGHLLIGVTQAGAFQSARQTSEIADFCRAAPTAIFIDESQEYKGWDTLRVNNLWKVRPHAARRYEFSGDPSPNGYVDLFSQLMFLDPNILGHASLQSFKNQFCVFGGYKTKEVVSYKNVEELSALIAPHCEFVKITDCMDMPERRWHDAVFEPTDQQRELYARLKRDFVIEVERAGSTRDKHLVQRICKDAATKFLGMQMVANGWFRANPMEDGEQGELVVLNHERAMFTAEVLVGDAPKVVVWARFHADLDSLAHAFAECGINAVEFSGRLDDKTNEAHKLRFQNDPACRVFYGTAASGGTSLNLQVANRMVYFSNSFNWGDRNQSERRIWRAGQREHCSYHDVIGFPIDRIIRANNVKKRDMGEVLRQVTELARLAEEL